MCPTCKKASDRLTVMWAMCITSLLIEWLGTLELWWRERRVLVIYYFSFITQSLPLGGFPKILENPFNPPAILNRSWRQSSGLCLQVASTGLLKPIIDLSVTCHTINVSDGSHDANATSKQRLECLLKLLHWIAVKLERWNIMTLPCRFIYLFFGQLLK